MTDNQSKDEIRKKATAVIVPGQPLKFEDNGQLDEEGEAAARASDSFFSAISETLARYRDAGHKLLEGKYASLKHIAPLHMRKPYNIYILRCKDGIFVRYDRASDGEEHVRCWEPSLTLAEISPQLSDNMIHFPEDPDTYVPAKPPYELCMKKTAKDGTTEEILRYSGVLYASSKFPDGFEIPKPPARPSCLVSVQNEFRYQLGGITGPLNVPLDPPSPDTQHFITQGPPVSLPVGWQAIEVYPLLGDEYWRPEYGPLWAEIDILGAVASENIKQSNLNNLDSRGATRKSYAALLTEFERLLNGLEEPVHQFLKQHPELLCPTASKSMSKVPFGDRVSDFVFCEPPNDYLLVEIEAPIRKLFRKDGQQRQELTHAINQILDWIRYINDHKPEVEQELGLIGISSNPRALVVIGRSASLTDDDGRKLIMIQARHNNLRILTYDDLLATARSNLTRILGPLAKQEAGTEDYYFRP
jgi:hypothetical protein